MKLTCYAYYARLEAPSEVLVERSDHEFPTVTKAYEDLEPDREKPGYNFLNSVIYKDGVLAEYD